MSFLWERNYLPDKMTTLENLLLNNLLWIYFLLIHSNL